MAEDKTRLGLKPIPILNAEEFKHRVVEAYEDGSADLKLAADADTARTLIPAGTGELRDFSYLATETPKLIMDKCVGCMDCVTQCPDTAILAKVITEDSLEKQLDEQENLAEKERIQTHFVKTTKYYDVPKKKGQDGGLFGLFIDPTKCKGCAECVQVCDPHNALEMVTKEAETVVTYQKDLDAFNKMPGTPPEFINEKSLVDMMLSENSLLYKGGAGSCMGCGEATALRMLMAATGFAYGPDSFAFVAATGCNTVYGSTYPYNPYTVPWTNSLFENAPTDAMGIRMRWNQKGLHDKKLWVIGGDGAMYDIGFQSLSRMLTSGMNINVIVLDTQVYSNTGGQASTASFLGQESKMSVHGSAVRGKTEKRKELGLLALMHPEVFVAQVIPSNQNHFYRAVMAANQFEGPSVVISYATCQPEHGVADDMAASQAKLACTSRAFPIFTYDPRGGDTIQERLDLLGNPAKDKDWFINPKSNEPVTFIDFARSEGRFSKHFDTEGNPSNELLAASQDRLDNWHRLQELAGLRTSANS